MTRFLLIAIVLAGGTVHVVRADEPRAGQDAGVPGELRLHVRDLVAQLDAATRAERLRAEQELLRLGPEVLPQLPASELLPNPAVRETVRRIRLTLERRKAQASLRPARVSLKGSLRFDEITRRIAEQTGNQIELKSTPPTVLGRTLNLDYDRADFWPVIDDLCERAGLQLRAGTNAIELLPGATAESRPVWVEYSGAFRVAVLSAEMRPLPGDARERILRCRMRLMIEPRLRALFLKFASEEVAALVAGVGMLKPFSPGARYELPMGAGAAQVDVQLDYRLPAGAEADVASLQGRMTMLVAAGEEQVAFDDLPRASGVARRRGGVTVELEDVRFVRVEDSGRTARVEVTVAYDVGGPAFESHRNWVYQNRAWLQGPDGRRREPRPDVTTRREADGAVALVYHFEGLEHEAGEYRFVYVAPTLLVNAPVEIDLAKIPVQSPAPLGETRPQP